MTQGESLTPLERVKLLANANRTRAILAAQKVRVKTDPEPTGEELTAEQRREMYAPKPAAPIIAHRPPMPLRVAKTTAKATGWGLGMFAAVVGGILLGESKQGFKS
jgi:hypothetical protein